jgi:hypothetical protein
MYEELVALFHYIWFRLNEISSIIQKQVVLELIPSTRKHKTTTTHQTYPQHTCNCYFNPYSANVENSVGS